MLVCSNSFLLFEYLARTAHTSLSCNYNCISSVYKVFQFAAAIKMKVLRPILGSAAVHSEQILLGASQAYDILGGRHTET